jgi:hypothetical protein
MNDYRFTRAQVYSMETDQTLYEKEVSIDVFKQRCFGNNILTHLVSNCFVAHQDTYMYALALGTNPHPRIGEIYPTEPNEILHLPLFSPL